MPASTTKPGTPKLSEVARKVVAPDGIVSTMWPSVSRTCREKLGITFDPWQDQSGRLALSKRADGKLAAMIGGVGMSICRQAGKTHWLTGLIFGLSVNQPLLTVWSAHHARTHGETFLSMCAFAERQRVAPYIEQIFKGSGDEEIRFRNGSRILFGARERGFGRGIPGVDIIVADEAQIMTERAVDAMTATMNVSKFGLAFYVGTPPRPDDPSEAFTRMRDEAWDGSLQDAVWIEFGAEPGSKPDDRSVWPVMNPSYPHRTPAESILRLQRKLSPESFLREGMGIWQSPGEAHDPVIDMDVWGSMREVGEMAPTLVGTIALGVDMTADQKWVSIAAATRTADGHVRLEVGYHEAPSVAVVDKLVALIAAWDTCVLVINSTSPAKSIVAELVSRGIEPELTSASQMMEACGGFYTAAVTREFSHADDPRLTEALRGAEQRKTSSGAWGWNYLSPVVISPLQAATLAHWGLVTFGKEVAPDQSPTQTDDDDLVEVDELMHAGF